jgi:hypothetical protein
MAAAEATAEAVVTEMAAEAAIAAAANRKEDLRDKCVGKR